MYKKHVLNLGVYKMISICTQNVMVITKEELHPTHKWLWKSSMCYLSWVKEIVLLAY